MNKILVIFFINILLVEAKSLQVCPTCSISTLEQAIEIAERGDSLLLQKATYIAHELEISKPIHLVGEEGTIINGESIGGILTFTTDSFSISNIKLMNVGLSYVEDFAAIKVTRAKHFQIINNSMDSVFFGVLIEKSKFGLIQGNRITGVSKNEANSGNGIHIWHSGKMNIDNNVVNGMRDGIYFEFVTDSEIQHNYSHDNIRYGLHFMFSNNDVYHHNVFRNNGAGVAVMFSKFIEMFKNEFTHNWGSASYGLLLKEIYDAEIYDNIFEENTIGIKGEGCTRINYLNNKFIRNGWAIKIAGACYKNIFKWNDFLHNSLDLAYNSKVNDNVFEENYWSNYTGYDLDHNGIGDVPFRPVMLFSYIVNRTPEALVLLRSLFVDMINFSEKVSPIFTPDNLSDEKPRMVRIND